jgi:hypothetical protein
MMRVRVRVRVLGVRVRVSLMCSIKCLRFMHVLIRI